MTTTLLAPSMRLANEAIAKRIVAKVRDHSPAPGLLTLVGRFHGSNRMPTKIGSPRCCCDTWVNEEL
jgi:hypothetical protein